MLARIDVLVGGINKGRVSKKEIEKGVLSE